MLADTFVPVQTSFYCDIHTLEVELASLELEMAEDLQVVFPDKTKKNITKNGFNALCRLIKVPVGFAKKLNEDGKSHVLAYLQKQLSRAYLHEPVFALTRGEELLAFSTKDQLVFDTAHAEALDKALAQRATDSDKYELKSRQDYDGEVQYLFVTGRAKVENDPEQSEYEYAHLFVYNLSGLHKPYVTEVAVRSADQSLVYLPGKEMRTTIDARTFDVALGELISYLDNVTGPRWTMLEGYLKKLTAVDASLKEVKEVRSKLMKALRVDKEDTETAQRIEGYFDWKKISKAYDLKNMDPKPSPRWFMTAASPYQLFYVYSTLVREATHAPKTVPQEKVGNLFKLATKLMGKVPDLAEKNPPKIEW